MLATRLLIVGLTPMAVAVLGFEVVRVMGALTRW